MINEIREGTRYSYTSWDKEEMFWKNELTKLLNDLKLFVNEKKKVPWFNDFLDNIFYKREVGWDQTARKEKVLEDKGFYVLWQAW